MKRKKRWRSSDGFISMINKLDYVSKKKLLDLIESDEKKDIELVLLIGDNYKKVNDEAVKLGGSVEDLSYGFAIMKIPIESLDKAVKIEGIQYAEFPKSLYTSFGPTNKSSCIEEVWGKESVTGKGVLVGFIDTGIDYRHRAFMDESGNKTRIEYIYDLGKEEEWNKTAIDSWISGAGIGEEPPVDRYTHGTHVAGIACGRSDEDRYKGVAYDSSIIMVNFTREGDVVNAQSSQLMRGIKYIIGKSKELNMPAVLNLSYSTNNGAHDGRSLLELYISTITSLEKIVFVCAAGNMGDRGLHKSGILKKESKIEISIGAGEKGLILNLYRNFYQEISMSIRNPSGVSSGKISISRKINEVFVGKDKVIIYRDEANPYNSRGSIIVSIIPAGEIQQGIWSITLSKGDNSQEKYSMWLPIGDNLSPKTKFLNPTLEGTLGIPATVSSVISVGSYNSNTRTISSFSGRGDNEMEIKPDIAAPGENILSAIPGGGYDSLSGTSMATPQVAGAAALLMEWGIIKNNDPLMYGERVKYFLIRGAKRERQDVQYPNNKWGYGSMCLQEAFNISIMENSGMRVTGIEELKFGKVFTKEDYENYIVEYDDGLIEKINKIKYGSALRLDSHRAIISVKKGYLEKLKREVEEILFVEKSSLFTLNNTSPSDKANISYFHQNPYLTLRGNGVLVGIVDTGIDYLHQEFIYDDDTSKILNLWDQSGVGKNTPDLIGFGKEYSREDINRAIQQKVQGKDPYSIVDSKDDIGHGTQMAGLIGAIGKNPELTGAAPDSEFVIVKMKNAKNTLLKSKGVDADKIAYDSVDIILGIKYIVDVAKKNNKPIVIFIPMGTNRGAHDGSSLLERYLDEICKIRGVAVVTGTGNNGDTGTHTDGKFERRGEIKNIELKVGEKQKNLSLQIWGKKPDKLSVGLISPSGEIVDKIPAKLMETEEVKLVFEGSSVFITYSIPEEITGDELIDISIFNIKPGIWQLRVYGDFIVDGNYDIWLPQRELLEEGTEFLKPSPYTTSMVPGTARRIITCAAYDQNNNSILATSGRGNTRDNRILPHLAVGGVNVLTTQAGDGSGLISGSSPASAVLAGTIALLLEWGIVKGNDKTMYSTKIKTYLIRGTDRRQGDMYPNNLWGYGTLNLLSVFENIRGIEEVDKQIEEEEKFLIRMPNEIYTKLD